MLPTEQDIDAAKSVLRSAGIGVQDFRPIDMTPCSALGHPGCINGFTVNAGCFRSANGQFYSVLPECVREERCGEKYESTGGAPPYRA